MKPVYLFFALLITTLSFAQNRKSLLKEINAYQYNVCNNTSYQTLSNQQLIQLSTTYFKDNQYKAYEPSDSSIIFIKNTTASILETGDRVKHIIYLDIQNINGLKKIILTDETVFFKYPFSGVEPPKGRGSFYLNKIAFYKYMYHNLCGNDVEISEQLKRRVETHNNKQSKGKRQLIVGRDF